MEAYKPQIMPLRDEEKEIKGKIKKLELKLVKKEQSKEYQKLIETVLNHADTINTLDISGKKGLLKLVFKSITVEGGRLKDFELYEPFKSLYKGEGLKCQTKEKQEIVTIPESVCTYALSDAR